jgi:hypothetical protein
MKACSPRFVAVVFAVTAVLGVSTQARGAPLLLPAIQKARLAGAATDPVDYPVQMVGDAGGETVPIGSILALQLVVDPSKFALAGVASPVDAAPTFAYSSSTGLLDLSLSFNAETSLSLTPFDVLTLTYTPSGYGTAAVTSDSASLTAPAGGPVDVTPTQTGSLAIVPEPATALFLPSILPWFAAHRRRGRTTDLTLVRSTP